MMFLGDFFLAYIGLVFWGLVFFGCGGVALWVFAVSSSIRGLSNPITVFDAFKQDVFRASLFPGVTFGRPSSFRRPHL